MNFSPLITKILLIAAGLLVLLFLYNKHVSNIKSEALASYNANQAAEIIKNQKNYIDKIKQLEETNSKLTNQLQETNSKLDEASNKLIEETNKQFQQSSLIDKDNKPVETVPPILVETIRKLRNIK